MTKTREILRKKWVLKLSYREIGLSVGAAPSGVWQAIKRAEAAGLAAASIERILDHMGLPAVAPTIHRPRPPPQTELPFEDHAPTFEPDLPFRDDFES